MKKIPKVSVIIVNWNGGEVFRQCLETVSKIEYPNWELIVVDNGSADGSERFRVNGLKYKLIKNGTNLGFAPANNIGYEKASGDHILLLNNDTKIPKNLISVLVRKMESDSGIGVVQPKIYFMDKPGFLDNAGSFLTRTGFLVHWGFGERDSKEFDSEREVFAAKGACMLIRREVIEEVGLFDGKFVSYFEESDFCWRVWLYGYKVLYYPKVSILHKVGFTSKRLIAVDVNYHSMKNRIASLLKNLAFANLFTIFPIHLLMLCGLTAYYLFTFQFTKFWMILRALEWNSVNLNYLLGQRRSVQKLRKVEDSQIFGKLMHKFDFIQMLLHFKRIETDFARGKFPDYREVSMIGRLRGCIEFTKRHKLANKILIDVGSSTGLLESKLTSEKLKRIVGIEPNQEAVEFAIKNVQKAEFVVGTAGSLPAKSESADLVTMYDVIEHVPKGTEMEAFEEVKRVLKRGGVFLLSTPNDNLFTKLLDPAWYLGHRHYNTVKLRKMIEKVGLKVKNVEIRGSIWSSIYMLWFYTMKWVFGVKQPRNKWIEKKEDEGYNANGIFTVFIEAVK